VENIDKECQEKKGKMIDAKRGKEEAILRLTEKL
jgi:hypothetical protein